MSRTKWTGQQTVSTRTKRPDANMDMGYNFRQLMALQANSTLSTLLRNRMGQGNGARRDIESACGYIKDLKYSDYWDLYDRTDVATRVVETYPDFTWLQNPEVYEKEDSKETKFEKDWQEHVLECGPFAELRKLDILAGIGKFGLLVMGVNDGGSLESPLMPMTATATKHRSITYFRAYTEGEVKITSWDSEPNSLRYGLPLMYEVMPNNGQASYTVSTRVDQDGKTNNGSISEPFSGSFRVHYSRCLHFADNALCGSVWGVERLRRVFNRMSDIIKVVGGSAEMFWQGAFSGIAFEMDAEAEMSEPAKAAMKDDIDKYINNLQRTILLQGVKANPLSPSIASPKDHLDVQLTLISIASRIPKRILSGSEMGKLSSTQDAENWDLQITTRRTNVAKPALMSPYVSFCIRNGIVRPPVLSDKAFFIEWPAMSELSTVDKAKSADNFTTALETYCSKALYKAIKFADYLYYVWGFSSRESRALAAKFDESSFEVIRKEALKAEKTAAASPLAKAAKSKIDTKTASTKAKSKAKVSTKS